MAVAKPLHLRLFLEGEEVPVISAQISINLNSPAAAAIQVIPVDEIMDLYPRTMVHLFFLDNRADDIESQTLGASAGQTIDVRGQYRLLFAGEFVGFSFIQTPQSRGVVLQCLDFSNYWDSAHATALEYGVSGNAFTNVTVDGGSTGVFDDIVSHQSEQILSWIRQSPDTPGLQGVTGLAGGVIRMLEAMGGIPKHFHGINDFFTVAELRVRLLSQICAEEHDNTSKRLFGASVFDEWLRNGLQNIGLQVTFRDMLKLLCQYIYYEFVPNPAPKFQPSTEGTSKNQPGTPLELGKQPQGSKLRQDMVDSITDINAVVARGSTSTTAIVANAQAALTRCNNGNSALDALNAQRPALSGDITTVKSAISAAISTLKGVINNSDPKTTDLAKALDPIQKVINAIDNAKKKVSLTSTIVTSAQTQRLFTQILRPDCWFVPPPRCNVFFPDQYSQFSYERNMLSETTRVLLMEFDTMVGPDALLANRILAPNIGFKTTSLSKKANTSDYRLLMDHEIHTGILPKTEWLSNIAATGANKTSDDKTKIRNARLSWMDRVSLWHFFRYRFASRQASIGGRFNPFVVCGFPGVIIRSPYIIPGGLTVISRQTGQDVSEDQLLNVINEFADTFNAPNQILGMVGGVTHNIDQSGGTTSVSLHHARRHRGVDDAFIEQFIEGQAQKTSRAVKTSITLSQAQSDPKLMSILVGVTPQVPPTSSASSIVSKQPTTVSASSSVLAFNPVTGQFEESQAQSNYVVLDESGSASPNSTPPLTVKGQIDKVNRTDLLIPTPPGSITKGSQNGLYGKQGATVLGVEVLNPNLETLPGVGQVYSAVALYEDVPIEITNSIPIETVIRPPWFSNNFSNDNIGSNIYDLFFGCPSIVDELKTGGLSAESVVPGSMDDPDVSSFSSDQSPDDVISSLVDDEDSKNSLSIERAINVLSYVYGQVKSQGGDVDEFIRSYIDRPIATISDIFGSIDLEVTVGADGSAEATQGSVGFHTGAVNPSLVNQGNYAGIAEDLDLQLPRINNRGNPKSLPPSYDVRKDNKAKVINYITALSRGPGLRG